MNSPAGERGSTSDRTWLLAATSCSFHSQLVEKLANKDMKIKQNLNDAVEREESNPQPVDRQLK